MKTFLALALLAACGDNIHPSVDASFDFTDVDPPEIKPDDRAPTDAGVPDSGIAVPDLGTCDDSHVEINGHEHKCQHDKP